MSRPTRNVPRQRGAARPPRPRRTAAPDAGFAPPPALRPKPRRAARRGFTMVEALLAITVATVAGTATLASMYASMQSSDDALLAAVGWGLGEQLLDEVAAVRFPTTADARPSAGTPRAVFDDIDDFAGWSASPPLDRHGQRIGAETDSATASARLPVQQADLDHLARYRQTVLVERVVPTGTDSWTVVTQHTDYRRVTVRIDFTDAQGQPRTVARITRMFAYVPPGP